MPSAPIIAVIDDDADICVSLEGLLRSVGYRVRTFPSAEDFLALHAACDVACVVSDVQIPGRMSGLTLAERLAALDVKPPVILISAFADDAAQKAARQAGARALLKKPFDGEALMAHIAGAVARS